MTQQAMDPVEVDPVETAPQVEVDPGANGDPVEVDPQFDPEFDLDPEGGPDGVESDGVEAPVLAAPALMVLAANVSMVTGSSAFYLGGPTALAGTAAVAGTGAVLGAAIRHAHQVEARRRAQAEAAKGAKKKNDPAKASRDSRAPAGARPGRGPAVGGRGGGPGAKPGAGTGRRGPARGAGAHKTAGQGTGPGPGKSTGRVRKGRNGAQAGPGGFAALAGTAPGRGSAAARAAGGARGAGRGGGLLGALGRKGPGAGGRAGGGSPTGGLSGRVGGAAARVAGAARRAGAATGKATAGARRVGAGGQARVGRASHALTGARPVRKAISAAHAARRAAGRSITAGRGAASAARRARAAGASPAGVARAVRARLRAAQAAAQHRRTRQQSRLGQFLRRHGARAGAAGVAGLVGLGVGLGAGAWHAGRWGAWIGRAGWARFRQHPVPPSPSAWARSRAGRADAHQVQRARFLAGLDEEQEVRIEVEVVEREPVTSAYPPVVASITSLPPMGATRKAIGAGRGAGGTAVADTNTHTPHTTKGNTMSAGLGSSLLELSEQMVTAAGSYEPEGMLQWGEDLQLLEAVLENVAQAIQALRDSAGEDPINPEVLEAVEQIVQLQASCASAAADIHATFEASHAEDLSRLRDPRANEHKWDVSNNNQ